jgi:chorismate synthase
MLGVVMDGVPAGIAFAAADFESDLARRRSSGAPGTTPRRESDTPEIVSGVYNGHTTGAPLTVLFRNENTRSGDYAKFANHPRPSHADFVAAQKFHGFNDPRGGGHFSGRVTLGLVAAGVVAKKILNAGCAEGGNAGAVAPVCVSSKIVEIGGSRDGAQFENIIAAAMRDGDSVGGVIECRASGVPVGLGEPFFDSVESVAAHLMFSIPGVKGVEFGSGFAGARLRGSENNDPLVDARGTGTGLCITTASNNSGGIDGGITNGGEVVVRVAVKPTASIAREQQTWNFETGRVETLEIGGRHDACIALRAAVVAEACLAIALAESDRRQRI